MIFDKAEISTEAFSKEALSLAVIRDADKKIEEIRNIHQSHSTVAFCLEIWNHCAKFSNIFIWNSSWPILLETTPQWTYLFPNIQRVCQAKSLFPVLVFPALYLLSVGCFDLPKGTYTDPKGTKKAINSSLLEPIDQFHQNLVQSIQNFYKCFISTTSRLVSSKSLKIASCMTGQEKPFMRWNPLYPFIIINLSVKTLLKLYSSLIEPIILYGSEIWISDFNININNQGCSQPVNEVYAKKGKGSGWRKAPIAGMLLDFIKFVIIIIFFLQINALYIPYLE